MKVLSIVALLCVSQLALASLPEKILSSPLAEQWKAWKVKFNKQYDSSVEEINRFNIWSETVEKIKDHNIAYDLGLKTYDCGLNEFSDLTGVEFASTRKGYLASADSSVTLETVETNEGGAPDSQDWRKHGYVTPVKNQGQCGSCWSFSSTGSLEGQHFNSTGKLVSLSEQQLVDCDSTCYGCNGGRVDSAFDWWIRHGGAVLESDYPYTARDGSCKNSGKRVAATLRKYHNVAKGSESGLKQSSGTVGPVSVAIDASHYSFQNYRSGVYYEPRCSSYRLDHAVLVVGYGSSAGSDYWIVKNSWGRSWGQQGYIWMARNRNNNCGIATDALYPIV